MAKPKKPKPKAGDAEYKPTQQEITALDEHIARIKAAPPAPRIKIVKDAGVPKLALDHPNNAIALLLMLKTLGTTDQDFMNGLLSHMADASSQGRELDEVSINFVLSVVKGIKPKDQVEAMLAVQMAAIHTATMTFARRLARVETIPQQDSAERALNKLTRTFAAQMEALKRYRTGGEQKVTVQHVSVSEGGQAIVGNVTQGAGEAAPQEPADKTSALTDARQPAMPTIGERERAPVPLRRKKYGGQSSA